MRPLKYDVPVNYVKVPDVPIAGALSRVSPQPSPSNGQFPEICVHHITQNLPASPTNLQRIRDEIEKDPTLSLLKEVVFGGWPQKRQDWAPNPSMIIGISEKSWPHCDTAPSQTWSLKHHTPRQFGEGEVPFSSSYICLLALNYKGNHQPS